MTAGAPPAVRSRRIRAITGRIGKATVSALDEAGFERGPRRLLLGVSGGADSSAMALALAGWAPRHGWELIAAHVDHGILRPVDRAALREGAERVARLAGLPWRCRAVDVPRRRARGESLEAAARQARYEALAALAAECAADAVIAAHTMDDQAETVLLHLIRGSGVDGIGAMRPAGHLPLSGEMLPPLLRPLLAVRRAETEAVCAAWGVVPVDDPSNRDRRLTRNRVRAEVLPGLAALNPRIVPALARLAEDAGADSGFLDELARQAQEDARLSDLPNGVILDMRGLEKLHRALRRRVLRAAFRAVGAPLPSAERVDAIEALIAARNGRVECPGAVLEARQRRLYLHALGRPPAGSC